jgi:hypothetical protein
MLTILFLCLAAIFKAIADTLKDHYDTSVFKWKNRRFWDPSVSWEYVGYVRFTKYHPDAWHLFNSALIISFSLAIVLHKSIVPWYFEVMIAGLVYNAVFNLFYNKILRKP